MIEEKQENDDYIVEVIIKRITNNPKLYKSYIVKCTQRKYTLDEILKCIMLVLRLNVTWRNAAKLSGTKISYGTLYSTYIKLLKDNIIDECYKITVNNYIKKFPCNKLDVRMTDTTVIHNKYGRETIGRNKHYNNKRITKISLIAYIEGVPLDVKIYSGNKNDSKILEDHINVESVMDETLDRKYRNIMLADKGYDSNKLREILEDKCYKTIIIDYNSRNTKDEKKKKVLTREERRIYNMRIRIEQTFMKLKRYRRINERYDCKTQMYEGFVKMALIEIIKRNT